MIEQALAGTRNFKLPKVEKPAIDQEQSEEVRRILTVFQHKFIPEMVLDVSLIKVLLDGKEAAAASRFSINE